MTDAAHASHRYEDIGGIIEIIEIYVFCPAGLEILSTEESMKNFDGLDARTIKERVDMTRLWSAWVKADDPRRHSFASSVGWETRSDRD